MNTGAVRNDTCTKRSCIIVLSTVLTPRRRFMLVDLPELGSMKQTLYELIRPVMEEWDGGVPLVPSAIYGIRIYTEGSILQVPRRLQLLTDGTTLFGSIFHVMRQVSRECSPASTAPASTPRAPSCRCPN